jgi:hypothetical protein
MIEECKFSSSLDNLDVIGIANVLQNSGIKKNVSCYRIDGSTNNKARQKACDHINVIMEKINLLDKNIIILFVTL